jgi:D-glycero-D-manno-heptose 1,7-bisphosphate phosphatase
MKLAHVKKIIFIDLDGTIREPIEGKFVDIPENQQVIPGAFKALKHFHDKGWRIVGISNQEGVEYGYKTLESCIREMQLTSEMFPSLAGIIFCPDMAGNDAVAVLRKTMQKFSFEDKLGYTKCHKIYPDMTFRKPGVGMFHLAIQHFFQLPSEEFIPLSQVDSNYDCWMIGHRPGDEKAAENLGIKFMAANVFRERFLPGMYEVKLTPQQIEFLEDIKLNK